VPFGPLLAWKRGDLLGAAQRLTAAGVASLIAVAVLWAWTRGGSALAPLAIGLAIFVIAGALSDLVERSGPVPHTVCNRDAACARIAAFDLGHGVRTCRCRRRLDRHSLRDYLEQRIYRNDEARRRRKGCGL
jgi:cytochrome c biogenesis factor